MLTMNRLIQKVKETDILKVFHNEKTPIHAMVRLSEYSLTWLVSQLYNNQQGKPLKLLPFQSVMLWMLWHKKFPLIVAARGTGKSFMLGLYALTRALLCPGSEIIILGSGLRQSLKVFEYISKLYNQSPLIQETIKKYDRSIGIVKSGPRIVMTGPYMKVGLSTITALPIGDGEKIRGQRACVDPNTIIETKDGLIRIKDSFDLANTNQEVYTGFDSFESPSHFIKTKPIDAYRIKTMMGYEIICSDLHKIYTDNGWKNVLDLKKGDKIPFKNQYQFPDKEYIKSDDIVIDEKMAWLMGVLVSEGCISRKHDFSIVNTDKDLVNKVISCLDVMNIQHQVYERPPKIDHRGWKTKKCWEIKWCNLKMREKMVKLGLKRETARSKSIPWSILYSNKDVIEAFLSGLFIGDGSAFLYKDRNRDNNFGIAYYTASEQLSIDLQVLLHKFGIFCGRSSRKSNLSNHLQYQLRFYGKNAHLIYHLLKIDKWKYIYKTCYKQSRFIKPYEFLPVIDVEKIEGKYVLYDYTVPVSKSFIGNCFINHNTQILLDETASINESIFETVIRPFAAVHANPEERVYVEEFCSRLKKIGAHDDIVDKILAMQGYGNQIVLSGTASFEFNHFFKHYQSYRMITESRGNIDVIKKAMEIRSRVSGDQFSRMSKEELKTLAKGWKNYAVFRMPYDEVPRGFLDAEVVANDKATFSIARFDMEYSCIFRKDSDGYIKRSIIEDATPRGDDSFSIELYGEPGREYVMGLDPAKFNDNFGLVVLKITPTGYNVVYADAWTGKDTPVSAKKIRDVFRRFNIVRIAIDQGGGGEAVAETLRDPKHCEDDELPLYPVREQIQDKRMLGDNALFILDVVKWSSSWIALTAPALEGDIQHHRLLFPTHPVIEDIYAQYERRALKGQRKIREDEAITITDVVFGKETEDFEIVKIGIWDNIQAMIDETCAIERTVTPGGVEKFELPSLTEQPEGMDIRRRDRFSALVLATYAARVYKDMNRNMKHGEPGGSPDSLLKFRRGRRQQIRRKGSVMY